MKTRTKATIEDLYDIREKIVVKHHVTEEEAEDIFFNNPRYRFIEAGNSKGDDVYSAMGQTDDG